MTALEDVAAERKRQMEKEGYSTVHDDEHIDGSLAQAAACYALPKRAVQDKTEYEFAPRGECKHPVIYKKVPVAWPESWHARHWKPKDRRRDLVRAAALIIAEIERLDRQAAAMNGEGRD